MKLMVNARESVAVSTSNLGSTFGLHTVTDPGTSGASEVSGGGYARKTLTWTPGAADGSVPSSEMEFDIPAGTTLRSISCWNGSTLQWTHTLPNEVPFTLASKYYLKVTLTVPQGT